VEIVILVALVLAALVVLGLVLRIVIPAVRGSRRGEIPTEEQRTQIMVLGGVGVVLALLALLIPALF